MYFYFNLHVHVRGINEEDALQKQLFEMEEKGLSFAECLKTAQKMGYAEADPTADIEGYDACRKIAILSSLMSGKNMKYVPLDIYDDMPRAMQAYISNYGWNFNKRACEYAVSLMRKKRKFI